MKKVALAVALFAGPAVAQDNEALVQFSVMKPETALRLAQAALEDCRGKGYQVGVTVVDRFGVTQVFLRDQFAGPHVEETSRRKAWTAVSFRTDTLALAEETGAGTISSGIRDLSQAIALGGGVPVDAAGSLVGGVGVSGAPGPDLDDACARAGIAAVEDDISF
ncbi:GlcG/HbpS family heme-binding protein [Defluviimonas salinarum]|uniref:Heme-binding protein n=1 Tax=Defluviimonas salinarum TaxID=2992147 RepID=A0ABT3J4L2_9RHOB|nr:heme-binding protein [Defluviimonas salinarum]MCW3782349.1 heme-binding protein [Defluviimonas salinarum]